MALPEPRPVDLADKRAATVRITARPPELSDADYLANVLQQTAGKTEADVERELVARFAALGIEIPTSTRPATAALALAAGPNAPSGDSPDNDIAAAAGHRRAESTTSNATELTVTPASPPSPPRISIPFALGDPGPLSPRKRPRALSFSQYDKYLGRLDAALDQPRTVAARPERPERRVGKLTRSGTRKGIQDFKWTLVSRLGRSRPVQTPIPCICCREDFSRQDNVLQRLPCGHTYCESCLAVVIEQSTAHEDKMPPRCCAQPVPSSIIKSILPRDRQQAFLKAVVQYATPWQKRVFCPNWQCGEFVPPPSRPDPKHPFEALCKLCRTRACLMCKGLAHHPGQDCPQDGELDKVLRMGEASGWRRCHRCRALVELAHGCIHITCRCRAEFCYICGAVWDPAVGCPNFCNGDEELERRRMEEEARLAELEAEKQAREAAAEAEEREQRQAERRTAESPEFKALRTNQAAEMTRFVAHEQRAAAAMRARQSDRKRALADRQAELADRMRERHARTEQHLEDRQVLAELELRASLEDEEKKAKLKLRHMEDYCDVASRRTNDDGNLPHREVTQRDMELLQQQRLLNDSMERRHRAAIRVLRERQARSMEELVTRHRAEMATLADRRASEVESLAVDCANEEEAFTQCFDERRQRMQWRWELAIEALKAEMEGKRGLPFVRVARPRWPDEDEGSDGVPTPPIQKGAESPSSESDVAVGMGSQEMERARVLVGMPA